jgi:hypothetical protein
MCRAAVTREGAVTMDLQDWRLELDAAVAKLAAKF